MAVEHFRIKIAYDGTNYSGWQIQSNADSIQGQIITAAKTLTQQPVKLHGAGRTDAGVHAHGQVAKLSISTHLSSDVLHRALNANLPGDIVIFSCDKCPEAFHPQYDAKWKYYAYRLICSDQRLVFGRQHVYRLAESLNFEAMRETLKCFEGEHDFASFQSHHSSNRDMNTVRHLYHVCMKQVGQVWTIHLVGDGFLYKMVRNIVGTLLDVGRGKLSAEDISHIIDQKHRPSAGAAAPASGLFLMHVEYEKLFKDINMTTKILDVDREINIDIN